MASGKLTPRQKMINMMYLVLTALLALNVSKEILLSFLTIANSLRSSSEKLGEKNHMLAENIKHTVEEQLQNNPNA
ncbi:MAG: gliding motility protein GldM, partial [Bacteroidia bacterium]|nr:gliding motility protein GldM [Bacteroidia bacterium]